MLSVVWVWPLKVSLMVKNSVEKKTLTFLLLATGCFTFETTAPNDFWQQQSVHCAWPLLKQFKRCLLKSPCCKGNLPVGDGRVNVQQWVTVLGGVCGGAVVSLLGVAGGGFVVESLQIHDVYQVDDRGHIVVDWN